MSHEDIRAAMAAATPGPWEVRVLGSEGHDVTGPPDSTRPGVRGRVPRRIARFGYLDWATDQANAELVAKAPEWLADLLAEVDTLRASLVERDEVVDEYRTHAAAMAARAEVAEQAVQRVQELHYAANNDWPRTPVCSTCEGKAGTHACGCWTETDRQPVCGHCWGAYGYSSVDYPCATIRVLDGGDPS